MRMQLLVLLVLAAGCGGGRIVSSAGVSDGIAWTREELAKDIAVRVLRSTSQATTMAIRLKTAEKPHIHADHDLVVTVLSGAGRVHIGGRTEVVRPGDVIEIPRGVPHWAENTDSSASVVYAVFTPQYDGKDSQPVGE